MRTKIASALRPMFKKALFEVLPSFSDTGKIEIPIGWRAFCSNVRGKFTAFVILCISPHDDRFTVELGWSGNGQIPQSAILQKETDVKTGESIRLSTLWHPQKIDEWWAIGKCRTLEEMANFEPDQDVEVKLLDVDAKGRLAIDHIRVYGIPYFVQIADRFGVETPFFGPR